MLTEHLKMYFSNQFLNFHLHYATIHVMGAKGFLISNTQYNVLKCPWIKCDHN